MAGDWRLIVSKEGLSFAWEDSGSLVLGGERSRIDFSRQAFRLYWRGEKLRLRFAARDRKGMLMSDSSAKQERLKRVLFVCVENSCRSQIAQAFARIHGVGIVEAYSGGSH